MVGQGFGQANAKARFLVRVLYRCPQTLFSRREGKPNWRNKSLWTKQENKEPRWQLIHLKPQLGTGLVCPWLCKCLFLNPVSEMRLTMASLLTEQYCWGDHLG